MVEDGAVELELGDRADADAHAERGNAPQVPLQPRDRVFLILRVGNPAFDQHATRPNGLGILGHERPLLRRGRSAGQHSDQDAQRMSPSPHHATLQDDRRLSRSSVTGPSLTTSICIDAWNTPVATVRPACLSAPTTASYSGLATGGGAAASKEGRRPFRQSPRIVNCETTSTSPPTSWTDRLRCREGSCGSSNTRISRIFPAM